MRGNNQKPGHASWTSIRNYFLAHKGTRSIFDRDFQPVLQGGQPLVIDKVEKLIVNDGAFGILKSDGSVITGGSPSHGGDSSDVSSQLREGVSHLMANEGAFAAIKTDGSVVSWGSPEHGGDSSAVASKLRNVVAFADPLREGVLTIDADALVPDQPSPPDLTTASDTGPSNTDNLTGDRTPTFTGDGEPGHMVYLYSNERLIGASETQEDGSWTITVEDGEELSSGHHQITTYLTDDEGYISDRSEALNISIYPFFESARKEISINKATSPNETIGQTQAIDHYPLTYSIDPNDNQDGHQYSIDPLTGLIYLSETQSSETGHQHEFKVTATNSLGFSHSQIISVLIDHQCPDTSPLKILQNGVSAGKKGLNGYCMLDGDIELIYQNEPALKITNAQGHYNDSILYIESGDVSALASKEDDPLFNGSFSIIYEESESEQPFESPIKGETTIAGLPINYTSLTLKNNGIALGFDEIKMPEPLDFLSIQDSQILINSEGSRISEDGKAPLNFFDKDENPNLHWVELLLADASGGGLTARYIDKPSADEGPELEDSLLIQGAAKFDFDKFFNIKDRISKPAPSTKSEESQITNGIALFEWKGSDGIRVKDGEFDFKGTIKPEIKRSIGPYSFSAPIANLGALKVHELSLSLNTFTDPIEVGGDLFLTLLFNKSAKVGGGIDAYYSESDGISLERVSISAKTQIPIGSTILMLTKVGLTLDNIYSDSNPLELTGSVEITDIGHYLKIIDENIPLLVKLEGLAKLTSENLKLEGKGEFFKKSVKFDGSVDLNWKDYYLKLEGQINAFNEAIKFNGSTTVSIADNLSMALKANIDFDVPGSIPWLGNRNLASADLLLQLSDDNNPENDHALIWGSTELPFIGYKQFGLKITDGDNGIDWDWIGLNDIPPVGSWDIEESTDYFLMTLNAAGALETPEVKVELPDGLWVGQEQFADHGIALVPELSDQDTSVVIVQNPEPGRWDIEAKNPEMYTDIQTEAFIFSPELSEP